MADLKNLNLSSDAELLEDYRGNSLTNIDTSIESHLIAFAAEESRLNHTVIDMKEYKLGLLKIAYEFAVDKINGYLNDPIAIKYATA